MSNKRPECAVKNCDNEAIIIFANKLICGDCLMKVYNKNQEQIWKELEEEK
ncbi:hypothetical protein KAI04_04820 [Candidatus Pacearchaeota archaeon]|nr:hypothetical protein [Candidatus Pacearchaeota archaeon]